MAKKSDTKWLLNILCLVCLVFQSLTVHAQVWCRVSSYYDTDINESIHHIQGILQDKNGMIWITTWGGMFSFDGKKFAAHNKYASNVFGLATNSSRGIYPCPTGDNWHIAGDHREARLTDIHGTQWRISPKGQVFYSLADGTEQEYVGLPEFKGYRGCFIDQQKNAWIICYDSLHKLVFSDDKIKYIDNCIGEPIRSMHRFRDGQYWLCKRHSKTIVIYDRQNNLIGYLNKNGVVSDKNTSFGSAVYTIEESDDGSIWLGTRHDGLFRLTPCANGAYEIKHITNESCKHYDVYDIAHDRHGRLWLAMLDGGIGYVDSPLSGKSMTVKRLPNYDYEGFSRVHNLAVYNDTLVIASSYGLAVADISSIRNSDIRFNYHRYDENREAGLGSDLTDFVYFDSKKRLFVCTENAGINVCTSPRLLDKELTFSYINKEDGLPDISYSLIELGGKLIMTSLHSLAVIESDGKTNKFKISCFGPDFFGHRFRFVEIPPMETTSGQWIVSTDTGAIIIDPNALKLDTYVPRIAITSLEIPNQKPLKYTEIPGELTIKPNQRSLRIEFAALDYSNPDGIYYSYRLKNLHENWISLGHDKSVSFTNLPPGEHLLEIRSSNGAGVWSDNTVSINLNVTPLFIETNWSILLFILLGISIACIIIYTMTYIRNIRRKHKEVISAYLSLIGKKEYAESLIVHEVEISDRDDKFVQKLTSYINDNMSDSNLKIENVAKHMAVSVSTLTRLTKSLMGITPGDFLAKARIRKATVYLENNRNMQISEIAHICGFSDPKYFSRCFKTEMKMSPSEYRNKQCSN